MSYEAVSKAPSAGAAVRCGREPLQRANGTKGTYVTRRSQTEAGLVAGLAIGCLGSIQPFEPR